MDKILNNHEKTTRLKKWASDLGLVYNPSMDWVTDNHERIATYIKSHISVNGEPYSTQTQRAFFHLLHTVLKNKGEIEPAEIYAGKVRELNNQINDDEYKQQMTAKEAKNWVSHTEIKTKLDELANKYNKNKTRNNNFRYLAIALYYYQPPLRNNYAGMEYIHDPTNETYDDLDINYLINRGTYYDILINNDKVSNKKGSSIIPIKNKTLINILKESFERFPRLYVFSQLANNNEPMTQQYMTRHILNNIWTNKNVGIDILRSSYITWFYENNPDILSRQRLADHMRNSRHIAEVAYYKPNRKETETDEEAETEPETEPETDQDEETESDEETQKKGRKKKETAPPKQKNKYKNDAGYFDLKEWGKQYRKDNAEQFRKNTAEYYKKNNYDVLRKKFLFNLNTGNTTKPRETTIKKYNITYNTTDNRWE